MKLQKREITLNEADSLRDMLYFEEHLSKKYLDGARNAERKETESEFSQMHTELNKTMEDLKESLEKSLKTVGIAPRKIKE